MEDWPNPRWGHPLPYPSKYSRPRALFWLFLIAVVTGISLYFSYLYARENIDQESLIIIPDRVCFPFSSEFLSTARYLVSSIEGNAKEISISYISVNSKPNKIKYNPVIIYCSPDNPNWFLELEIQVSRNPFFPNGYQAEYLNPAETYDYNCSSNFTVTPTTTAPEAFIIARSYLLSKYPPENFKWPDRIELIITPIRGYVWEFYYDDFFPESRDLIFDVVSSSEHVIIKQD